MVAGRDSHFAETVGLGVTEIEAEDVDSVLDELVGPGFRKEDAAEVLSG
jgi:hypothetical protein